MDGYSLSFSIKGWPEVRVELFCWGELLRLESSTRALWRWSSASRRDFRNDASEGKTVMFGSEEESEVSIEEERYRSAKILFSEARDRRARAFLGLDNKA